MLRFSRGNLLDAPADALVNTVNEVGVMGKGIALMFRERFPENTRVYTAASEAKQVRVGHMLVTETGELFPKWIINFPTKKHWRNPSKLEWVRAGLQDLVRVVRELGIRSIAIPPLGCGNGGLEWADVRPLIEEAMAQVPGVEALVFEPTAAYQNAPKAAGVEKLTAARALVAELVRRYAVLGLDCTVLEVQKLAWFLDRAVKRLGLPDPLKLAFAANKYGPYADRLRHLLNGLDGSYLHSEKRLSDASPMDLIWFEDARREEVAAYIETEAAKYRPALEMTAELIDGFESPLGMELLATVDWLLAHEGADPTVDGIRRALTTWPGGATAAERKQRLFDDRLIALALERLQSTTYATV
jgi:O-acetyl-ADP-ribose deacetylase (regulator of RNase III)